MSNFIKGIIIGIAKILPGISGSVIAISFNVYFECIKILNKFYKMTKKEFMYIFPISLGILVGILGFSLILKDVYTKYYFSVMLLFIFLIIKETAKDIIVNLKNDILFYFLFILLYFILHFFFTFEIKISNNYLLYSFLAFIEAFTMIIPGISGSAILISLGLYETYLNFVSSLVSISFIINNFDIFLIYSLVLIISAFITIKIIYKIYQKTNFLSSIIRVLMFFSIVMMIKNLF